MLLLVVGVETEAWFGSTMPDSLRSQPVSVRAYSFSMSYCPDPASMIEAAQTAAATVEYAVPSNCSVTPLRDRKPRSVSSHADLATTLDNLAFVCERTNKIEEAVRGYRRAHAIAVASPPPGHR